VGEVGEVGNQLRVEYPPAGEGEGEGVGEGEHHWLLIRLCSEDRKEGDEGADGECFPLQVAVQEGLPTHVEDDLEAGGGVGGQAHEGHERPVERAGREGRQGGDIGVEGGPHVGDGARAAVAQGEEGAVEDPMGVVDQSVLGGRYGCVCAGD
jgi:hypothetical protein